MIPHRSSVAGADAHYKNRTLQTESYKVKKGDTLVRIAKKTGVSVKELKRLNSLGNKVKPGRVLALRRGCGDVEPRQHIAKRVQL
ncbi:MAG TPA: LysM peptidoglycan-binding domain-containing protein, partial [Geobacteraceae bacterium]|nr:LysM peptidoglycan-binding domain-containing protein [Geobacteraceae bacterium]